MPFKPKLNAPSTTNVFIDFSQTSLYTSPIINASTINKDLLSNSYYSTSLSQSLVSTFPINDYIINSESCSFEYFYKNIKTNECKRLCSLNEFINEMCIINNLTENNIMNITQHIRNVMTNLHISKDLNLVINGNNSIYQIISSEKMDDNKNRNVSIIELGECGEKLKKMYNIDYIIILKVDIFLTNSTNVVLKYEIYNPYTLEKIDLSICSGMLIDTYLPYSLSDEDLELFINLDKLGYDLFNPNDSFYHDICIPYTTFNKTDILLDDRRKDYFKNLSFCEENCTYKQYNYIYEKVQCECIIKKDEIKSNINNNKNIQKNENKERNNNKDTNNKKEVILITEKGGLDKKREYNRHKSDNFREIQNKNKLQNYQKTETSSSLNENINILERQPKFSIRNKYKMKKLNEAI